MVVFNDILSFASHLSGMLISVYFLFISYFEGKLVWNSSLSRKSVLSAYVCGIIKYKNGVHLYFQTLIYFLLCTSVRRLI